MNTIELGEIRPFEVSGRFIWMISYMCKTWIVVLLSVVITTRVDGYSDYHFVLLSDTHIGSEVCIIHPHIPLPTPIQIYPPPFHATDLSTHPIYLPPLHTYSPTPIITYRMEQCYYWQLLKQSIAWYFLKKTFSSSLLQVILSLTGTLASTFSLPLTHIQGMWQTQLHKGNIKKQEAFWINYPSLITLL